MGLKANRGRQPKAPQGGNNVAQSQEQAPTVTANGGVHDQTPETPANNVPAQAPQAQAPARSGGNQIADVNAGVLDNVDDMDIGGNYVTMDGSEFLYKNSNETATEIDIVVTYGKRFYQWYDEDNQQYHNSDQKLDDRYKMKFEIRWQEDEDGEATEYIMTLPTASAMNFVSYVKGLAKNGLRINQVMTRLTISRQKSQDGQFRFSRTEFENLGIVE